MSRGRALLSMSGYGRGTARRGGWTAVCEIRCVNHRYLDIDLAVPDSLLSADVPLRRLIRKGIGRGHVDLKLSLVPPARGREGKPKIDMALARWYADKFTSIARSMKLVRPGAEALARMPGVVERAASPRCEREALAAALAAARAALTRNQGMRAREGRALFRDIMGRLDRAEGTLKRIAKAWPAARERYWRRIEERMREALARLGKSSKPVRAREVMSLIERGDASEELARLHSLCVQFRRSALKGSPAGRRLDFLAQELQREGNTLGAKSAGEAKAGVVLELREEVERIREQVQNIE